MGICSLAVRGVGAAVLIAVGAPPPATAHDQDEVKAQVTPAIAALGARVDVRVKGCDGTTGAAGSGAFTRDAQLTGRDGKGNTLSGTTRIRQGVSGTYEITVTCDGHPHQGVGTVQVKGAGAGTGQAPTAPVRAGGGGAAPLTSAAAEADEAGPGTRHAVVGLVLAGVAAIAVALRSVRRRRPE
ncbi:hypothetical protein [Streptomyces flavofungini]|uniref:hypothetical protein n=1 Tax=Streptomyces flavofungini TaxID=68200 RepID=UPI0025AFA1E6|nr:hypothetical protein [Streptomyces flavofungini]WJV48506.1 hypothetical protein QUY26_25085 [Streptomyces flavofungini]